MVYVFYRLPISRVLQEHSSGHIGHFGYRERAQQADVTARSIRHDLDADVRPRGQVRQVHELRVHHLGRGHRAVQHRLIVHDVHQRRGRARRAGLPHQGAPVTSPGRPPDVSGLTSGELQRTRRELATSLALLRLGSPAQVPILAHMTAIDAELANRAAPPA